MVDRHFMKIKTSDDGLMKASFPDSIFFHTSCERRFNKRCRAEGIDPDLLVMILGGEKYTTIKAQGDLMVVRQFEHKKNNQLRVVKVPLWFAPVLEGIAT